MAWDFTTSYSSFACSPQTLQHLLRHTRSFFRGALSYFSYLALTFLSSSAFALVCSMSVTLDSLSDSILLKIRFFLLGDINSHVALARTCRRLRDLYKDDDEFWQIVCFSAGFGRPLRRGNPGEQLTWREVAHTLSGHSLKCEIRSCRDAHLYFGTFWLFFPALLLTRTSQYDPS